MMTGFASYRSIPQSARANAAASCKTMADNTRQSLQQAGCKVPAASTATTAATDPVPIPALPRDKPYPITIRGFNAAQVRSKPVDLS